MVINFIFSFFLGMLVTLGLLALNLSGQGAVQRVKRYFGSPLDYSFHWDWAIKQFYKLFSEGASERWYESRTHCNRNFFVSMLCAIGLIHVVRFTYAEEEGRLVKYRYKYVIYHALRKESELRALIKKQIKAFDSDQTTPMFYFEGLFIAGRNVVTDL